MNQIRGGIILNYVIIVLNIVLGLLYTPYMLRMLGPNEYGLYSLVASIITYLTILDFGFGNAIIRYTSKLIAEKKTSEQWDLFGTFLIVYTIVGILAFVLGLGLYFNIDILFEQKMTPEDISQARIMMLMLLFNVAITFPLSIFGSIILAYQDFIFQRILTILRLLLSTGVIVLLLYVGYKAVAMVVIQTIFNILVLLINCLYCFKKLKIKIRFKGFNWNILKEICMYSMWIFIGTIIDRIYWGTGQFVLGSIIGTVAVAIFSVAILLQQMYMTFSSSINNVLLPKLTAMVAHGESDSNISSLFIKTGRLQCLIMAFILSGFLIFGKKFIYYWAGPDYDQSYILTVIFFVSLFVPTIQTLGYTILQARNQLKFRSLVYMAIAAVSLILQIILTKYLGIIGCAIAIGGALILGQGVIMNIYYFKSQHINIPKFWKEMISILLCPATLTAIGIYINNYIEIETITQLFVHIAIYSIAYMSLTYMFSMNRYEKSLVMNLYNKILIFKHKD